MATYQVMSHEVPVIGFYFIWHHTRFYRSHKTSNRLQLWRNDIVLNAEKILFYLQVISKHLLQYKGQTLVQLTELHF
jgi:hypothetical protein